MVAAWSALAFRAHRRGGFKNFAVVGLLTLLALQVVAASTAAIASNLNPIGKYACQLGIYGTLVSPLILVVEAAVLVFLYRLWPKDSEGLRRGFWPWVSIWLLLCTTSLLVHIRSATMCSV